MYVYAVGFFLWGTRHSAIYYTPPASCMPVGKYNAVSIEMRSQETTHTMRIATEQQFNSDIPRLGNSKSRGHVENLNNGKNLHHH